MKKKDIELIFKGADDQSFQELLDDLRPKGEWIFLGDNPNRYNPTQSHSWSCSQCGHGVKEQENFCPHCGAKMKGGIDNTSTVAINKDFYKIDKSNPINRSDLFQ